MNQKLRGNGLVHKPILQEHVFLASALIRGNEKETSRREGRSLLTVTGTYPQVGTQVKKNITTNPC